MNEELRLFPSPRIGDVGQTTHIQSGQGMSDVRMRDHEPMGPATRRWCFVGSICVKACCFLTGSRLTFFYHSGSNHQHLSKGERDLRQEPTVVSGQFSVRKQPANGYHSHDRYGSNFISESLPEKHDTAA